MKKKTIFIVLLVVLLFVLCSFYFYYENTKLSVSNYTIRNAKIPSAFNDYKIAQIADLHNVKSKTLISELIKKIKSQKPDMIVITGDLIDSKTYDIQIAMDFIEKIKDVAPIYYVPGNHEAWSGKYKSIRSNLAEKEVYVLDNEMRTITIHQENMAILGIVDPDFYPSYLGNQTNSNLEDVVSPLEENNTFKILLSHRPELFENYVKYDIDLVLTGHAHGGQVRIPFVGGLIAPNQGLFPKYTFGKFQKNKTTMLISRGIGNSILPLRINNRPELVVVTLSNKK